MIDAARHVPLRPIPWDPDTVSAAIADIASDAIDRFDPDRFWPAHPQDDESTDGDASLYFGAAGVIWALDHLRRIGAISLPFDFRPHTHRFLDAGKAQFASVGDYAAHGSLLCGDLGTGLVLMRLAPDSDIADFIYARAAANNGLPLRELMWGTPGSMLACVHMAELTGETRWRALFAVQAERLLSELEETPNGPLWTQDLYGRKVQYLGPAHGFAGNMIPLLRAWDWLTESQRGLIAEAVPRTLAANACRFDYGTSWHPLPCNDRPLSLCQHCHGAPGMVTTFADAPFTSSDLESLLREGGNFTWAAGPLAKGSNLCHGTGGNGYAFLKLFRRTQESIWLERARAFAMTAIAQCREARAQYGRGRYSLWTGDIGLAIYLSDCLTAEPHFPTIDIF